MCIVIGVCEKRKKEGKELKASRRRKEIDHPERRVSHMCLYGVVYFMMI